MRRNFMVGLSSIRYVNGVTYTLNLNHEDPLYKEQYDEAQKLLNNGWHEVAFITEDRTTDKQKEINTITNFTIETAYIIILEIND